MELERPETDGGVSAGGGPRPEARSFIVFKAGRERYAVDARYVFQVLKAGNITPVPRTAPYLMGVIEMRGSFVPVFDHALLDGIGWQVRSGEPHVVAFGEREPELAFICEGTPDYAALVETDAGTLVAADGRDCPEGGVTLIDGETLLADRRFYL